MPTQRGCPQFPFSAEVQLPVLYTNAPQLSSIAALAKACLTQCKACPYVTTASLLQQLQTLISAAAQQQFMRTHAEGLCLQCQADDGNIAVQ